MTAARRKAIADWLDAGLANSPKLGRRVSVAELGRTSKVSRETLYGILRANRDASDPTLSRVAKALGVEPPEFSIGKAPTTVRDERVRYGDGGGLSSISAELRRLGAQILGEAAEIEALAQGASADLAGKVGRAVETSMRDGAGAALLAAAIPRPAAGQQLPPASGQ
jgi:transcriptional regulator with XRE-family HTH domain